MNCFVRPARFPEETDLVRVLFRAYQKEIGFDLCFQGFEAELSGLPGSYASPLGTLLCAETSARVVGCVALRPLAEKSAEMKRLFVEPAHRELGIAKKLVGSLLLEARRMGHCRIFLDTVPGMEAAQNLYVSLGFRDVPAYTHNPVGGVRYMALDL